MDLLFVVVCVHKCTRVECALTTPARAECGIFVMCCVQCCLSVSTVL